ncbi:MAG: NAD-dependent deacylase [Schleiferiaceae bacterium]
MENSSSEKPKKLVVLTGAGMSAESGLATFRDSGGLWENYNVYEVATPEAWLADPEKVLHFYNLRRRQLEEVEPNSAHFYLAQLEEEMEVQIITQNVDDLHERAGSSKILHLHGELRKARSVNDPSYIVEVEGTDLTSDDMAPDGSTMRPHVVWFGEDVPMMVPAIELVSQADHVLIIGTSLQVYPAAQLMDYRSPGVKVTVIDPGDLSLQPGVHHIKKSATKGVLDLPW